MRIVLLGAPGAGKGTIAKLIAENFSAVQISTGDILRSQIKKRTALGDAAKKYMEAGQLVPDELILEMVEKRLNEPDCAQGFILDGFPRTIPQADRLKAILQKMDMALDYVINLEAPFEIILERLATRRTCSNSSCQEIYNLKNNPPADGGKCKKCGQPVVQRDDETEEAIAERIRIYQEKTAPLIEYYQKEKLLVRVASLHADETFAQIKALKEQGKGSPTVCVVS